MIHFKSIIKSVLRSLKKIIPPKKIYANVVSLDESHLLSNKYALITGGTSGIGKAIAIAFIKAGAHVIITGRNADKINTALNDIKKVVPSDKISGNVLDVSDIGSMQKKFENIVNSPNFKKIDILVNNAGISLSPKSDLLEEEVGYNSVMNTNLKGNYFLSKIVAEYMIANNIEGNILNIASTSSNRPATNAYSLSKWGIKGLTIGLAKQLINHNIVVNGIAPGPTATPMMGINPDNNIALPNNPSSRFALPEEIANMAVILTSGIGRLVVGDIVYMGGGSGIITVDDIDY